MAWESTNNEWGRKKTQPEAKIIIIPPEVLKIANPELSKEDLDAFLTCVCGGKVNVYSIKDRLVELRCNCGALFGYPDDHPYFNIKKKNKEIPCTPKEEEKLRCSCGAEITGIQAKTSFDLLGHKACQVCVGKELV